jgi:lipopolysaccharide transport system ATP-binding protein
MTVIELKTVSKKFTKHTNRPLATTLKSYFLHDFWRAGKTHNNVIWALRDINLKVEEGQTLGIIGRNGSGKSTLLKLINRILRPDQGFVSVEGNIAALIELGAGFHPELTGKENVIINGIILGLTKNEIKAKFEEIVDFAELWDFIDEPVRTYSSGMSMRLGFSVAVHIDPKILMIDEVFAVGDIKFNQKCMERMNHFKKAGKTIVIVTHDLETVKNWCDEVIWIDGGQLKLKGKPVEVVKAYTKEML